MYICPNYLVAISQNNARTFFKNFVIFLTVCAYVLGTLHLSEIFELNRKPVPSFPIPQSFSHGSWVL